MALFGEKYGDEVRVVSVGDWARELCGGTHAQRSGQLGLVKILGEASIGAGVRRVEALVGADAYQFLAREHALVAQLTEALKVRPEELPDRVAALTARLREVEKDLERLRSAAGAGGGRRARGRPDRRLRGRRGDPPGAGRHRAPTTCAGWCSTSAAGSRPTGRPPWPWSRSRNDRPVVVVAVNDKGREWGVKAGELVRVAAGVLGGGGGGKDDVAQGGGTDPAKVDEALRSIEHAVGQRVTGSA